MMKRRLMTHADRACYTEAAAYDLHAGLASDDQRRYCRKAMGSAASRAASIRSEAGTRPGQESDALPSGGYPSCTAHPLLLSRMEHIGSV